MSETTHYPMPSGVEAMSKQELWNWFSRCTHTAREQNSLSRKFFTMTTGLHPSYSHLKDPYEIIEAQHKRMVGLELQMAQMQKGYAKKLKKALAQATKEKS
jgi:hypothetical protein